MSNALNKPHEQTIYVILPLHRNEATTRTRRKKMDAKTTKTIRGNEIPFLTMHISFLKKAITFPTYLLSRLTTFSQPTEFILEQKQYCIELFLAGSQNSYTEEC